MGQFVLLCVSALTTDVAIRKGNLACKSQLAPNIFNSTRRKTMFNILVVEDDKHTRMLLSKILQTNGYNVILATDGEDALDKLEHNYIDLMVIDVMMPKMDW